MIYPSELWAVVELKLSQPLYKRANEGPDLKRCYELLHITSRSFAAVIEQLHPELRDAVMIFYIVLRALDTVEDDTGLDNKVKLPLLRKFHDVLKTTDWTFHDSSPTEKDAIVLREFDVVLREYHRLRPVYMDIISDITKKMGNGMADYITLEDQKNYEGVNSVRDYDLYCHYVAGIVGEGLTRMAIAAQFVTPKIAQNDTLYESMGLFLQKTNIIRDYREDMDDGRSFWPKEIWSKYTPQLRDFVDPKNRTQGRYCISNLVLLSLGHVIDCLDYLSNLREPSYFKFCAIPQVMSIATLELVFNNPTVFERNIKIRKGTAAQLILGSNNMRDVYGIFRHYVRLIHEKNKIQDPNYMEIEIACGKIEQYINANDTSCLEYKAAHTPPDKYSDDGTKIVLVSLGTAITVTAVIMLALYLEGVAPSADELKNEWQIFKKFIME